MGWPYQQKPPMGWPLDYDTGFADFVGARLMNEGSGNKVFDLSGNGRDGTITGATWVAGKYGSALDNNAAGDHVTFGSLPVMTAYTIIHYCRQPTSGHGTTYGRWWQGGNCYFRCNASATVHWLYLDGTLIYGGDFGITANSDVMLAVVCDGTDVNVYLNGLQAIATQTGEAQSTTTATWYIGGNAGALTADVRTELFLIYNYALSASEIALLCRYPFWMFKDPAEVALIGGYQAVAGIPIFRRRRAG